jgi:hypothetical protein
MQLHFCIILGSLLFFFFRASVFSHWRFLCILSINGKMAIFRYFNFVLHQGENKGHFAVLFCLFLLAFFQGIKL